MSSWIEKHGNTLVTAATIIVAFGASVTIFAQRLDAQDELIRLRFDAQDRYINQRFDAMDKRIDRLTDEAAELRRLAASISERVSRNEGWIDDPGTDSSRGRALAVNHPQAQPTRTGPLPATPRNTTDFL